MCILHIYKKAYVNAPKKQTWNYALNWKRVNQKKKKNVGTDMENNPWIEEGENENKTCRWEWKILKSKDGGVVINRDRPSRIGLLRVVFNFQVPIAVLKLQNHFLVPFLEVDSQYRIFPFIYFFLHYIFFIG